MVQKKTKKKSEVVKPKRRSRDAVEEPWQHNPSAPVFASIWTTGPDPTSDGALRLHALRRKPDGTWERFDRFTDPFPDRDDSLSAAGRRAIREFGVRTEDLEGQPTARELWSSFRDFLGEGTLLVPDKEEFSAWSAHLSGSAQLDLATVGLSETAALLLPGRLATRRSELAHELISVEAAADRASPRAILPEDLQAALAELLRRFHTHGEGVTAVAAHGYARAWAGLSSIEPDAAATLSRTLTLIERPSLWCESAAGSLPLGGELTDGVLSNALAQDVEDDELTFLLEPRWAEVGDAWKRHKTLPPKPLGPLPFAAADRVLVDDVFEVHLPHVFGLSPEEGHRPAQHDAARQVAATLGRERPAEDAPAELLLVHAPTGTGKTLAYLVPLLLWASKNGLRTAVSTYTRALQEQAYDSDVPRALSALRRAGVHDELRVSMLKGRENYACWRSTCLQNPTPDSNGEDWLAWTRFLLFCATDTEGDLDRLPETPPVPFSDNSTWRRADGALRGRIRARSGCCRLNDDRRTCAAHVARFKAERSHVVLTNQAFTLTNPQFATHVVFDECEHLHEQADSTFSHGISLRNIERLLDRLSKASGRSRGAFDRAKLVAAPGSATERGSTLGIENTESARLKLADLTVEVTNFLSWKKAAERTREERDCHSLMREFVLSGEGRLLIEARDELFKALGVIESSISDLSESLDELPSRRTAKVRRRLDLARIDVVEARTHVFAWIPLDEGSPVINPTRFYDASEMPNGDLELSARVLLPNELLGGLYYPELATAVFVSATTWLKGGFEASRFYLGIDHAENPPLEGKSVVPARVSTHCSPEAFDYERVLVCVPKDAPSPRDTQAHLAHIRRYIAYLGERTRGRILGLFTNAEHVRQVGKELEGFFRARSIPLWYQGMPGSGKEELSELFRRTTDSVLLGVDTFWYGADFPGPTLEHLVITKLPFGVPDRYHHAQCAALTQKEQRRKIYMPRALSKFRQGFGRLMRRESDRGVVHILDPRFLDPRNRSFQRELPLHNDFTDSDPKGLARFVRGDSDRCLRESLSHMELLSDIERRGLPLSFAEFQPTAAPIEASSPSDEIISTPNESPSNKDWTEDIMPWAHEDNSGEGS
jgi:Rad3-related DNA helicase